MDNDCRCRVVSLHELLSGGRNVLYAQNWVAESSATAYGYVPDRRGADNAGEGRRQQRSPKRQQQQLSQENTDSPGEVEAEISGRRAVII